MQLSLLEAHLASHLNNFIWTYGSLWGFCVLDSCVCIVDCVVSSFLGYTVFSSDSQLFKSSICYCSTILLAL